MLTIQERGSTSTAVPYCSVIAVVQATAPILAVPDIRADAQASMIAPPAEWVLRAVVSTPPAITDNGLNRLWKYTTGTITSLVGGGEYRAVCLKNGQGLLSPLGAIAPTAGNP